MSSILVIGDLHMPHEHPHALDFCKKLRDTHKCDEVVQIGDCYDYQSCSFHDRNPDLPGPKEEMMEAAKKSEKWHKEFPAMRICYGNHDQIPARHLVKVGLSEQCIKSNNSIYGTPTWKWAHEWILPGGKHRIWFRHIWAAGVIAKGGDGGFSVVAGHVHSKCQSIWSQYPSHSTFSLLTGCLIDPEHKAFAYNIRDARRPILGACVIKHGEPHIYRMWK